MTRPAKVVIKIVLTAAILAVTLGIVGLDRIGDALRRLDAATWLLALGICVSTHLLATFKWRFFLRLSGASLPFRDGVRCYAAGLFANLCLPTMIGGDVLRAGLAMAETRKRTAVVLGSLVDRSADLVGLGLLGLLGFLIALRPAAPHHSDDAATRWTPFVVLAVAVVLGIAAIVVLRKRWRPTGKAKKILIEVLIAFRRLKDRTPALAAGLAFSTALQFFLLLANRELGRSIGMTTDLGIWLFVWPLAKLVAMLPISIGGIGVREAAFLGLARPFGIVESMAVASSLAWQAVLLALGLLGGAVWFVLSWRIERRVGRAERRAT